MQTSLGAQSEDNARDRIDLNHSLFPYKANVYLSRTGLRIWRDAMTTYPPPPGFKEADLKSEEFKEFVSKDVEIIKRMKGMKRIEATKRSMNKTIEALSEKQAEAITFERIYLNLLDGRIDQEEAEVIIVALGYALNPNPIRWLKRQLTKLRQWIIDAVKWVKTLGEALKFKIKSITIDMGLTPRVSITLIPRD